MGFLVMKVYVVIQCLNGFFGKFFVLDFGFLEVDKVGIEFGDDGFELVQVSVNIVDVK